MNRKVRNKVTACAMATLIGIGTLNVDTVFADSSSGQGGSGSHTAGGNWYGSFNSNNTGWRVSVVDPNTGKMLSTHYLDITYANPTNATSTLSARTDSSTKRASITMDKFSSLLSTDLGISANTIKTAMDPIKDLGGNSYGTNGKNVVAFLKGQSTNVSTSYTDTLSWLKQNGNTSDIARFQANYKNYTNVDQLSDLAELWKAGKISTAYYSAMKMYVSKEIEGGNQIIRKMLVLKDNSGANYLDITQSTNTSYLEYLKNMATYVEELCEEQGIQLVASNGTHTTDAYKNKMEKALLEGLNLNYSAHSINSKALDVLYNNTLLRMQSVGTYNADLGTYTGSAKVLMEPIFWLYPTRSGNTTGNAPTVIDSYMGKSPTDIPIYRSNRLFYGTARDYTQFLAAWSKLCGKTVADVSHKSMLDSSIMGTVSLEAGSYLNNFSAGTVRDGVKVFKGNPQGQPTASLTADNSQSWGMLLFDVSGGTSNNIKGVSITHTWNDDFNTVNNAPLELHDSLQSDGTANQNTKDADETYTSQIVKYYKLNITAGTEKHTVELGPFTRTYTKSDILVEDEQLNAKTIGQYITILEVLQDSGVTIDLETFTSYFNNHLEDGEYVGSNNAVDIIKHLGNVNITAKQQELIAKAQANVDKVLTELAENNEVGDVATTVNGKRINPKGSLLTNIQNSINVDFYQKADTLSEEVDLGEDGELLEKYALLSSLSNLNKGVDFKVVDTKVIKSASTRPENLRYYSGEIDGTIYPSQPNMLYDLGLTLNSVYDQSNADGTYTRALAVQQGVGGLSLTTKQITPNTTLELDANAGETTLLMQLEASIDLNLSGAASKNGYTRSKTGVLTESQITKDFTMWANPPVPAWATNKPKFTWEYESHYLGGSHPETRWGSYFNGKTTVTYPYTVYIPHTTVMQDPRALYNLKPKTAIGDSYPNLLASKVKGTFTEVWNNETKEVIANINGGKEVLEGTDMSYTIWRGSDIPTLSSKFAVNTDLKTLLGEYSKVPNGRLGNTSGFGETLDLPAYGLEFKLHQEDGDYTTEGVCRVCSETNTVTHFTGDSWTQTGLIAVETYRGNDIFKGYLEDTSKLDGTLTNSSLSIGNKASRSSVLATFVNKVKLEFYPYIRMQWASNNGAGGEVNVVSEQLSTILPVDTAEVAWTSTAGEAGKTPNLTVTSNQFSGHARAQKLGGGIPVLPGGAVYYLDTLTNSNTVTSANMVSLVTYQTVIPNSAKSNYYTKLSNSDYSVENAQKASDETLKTLVENLENWQLVQWVSDDLSGADAWDSGIMLNGTGGEDLSGVKSGSAKTSTDKKYLVTEDKNKGLSNIASELDIDTTVLKDNTVYYKLFADTSGNIWGAYSNDIAELESLNENNKGMAQIVVLDTTLSYWDVKDTLSGKWIELDAKTAFVTSFVAALERGTGQDTNATWSNNGQWYNEAFDGVYLQRRQIDLGVGLSVNKETGPAKRMLTLDPNLTPKHETAGDIFTNAVMSQYRLAPATSNTASKSKGDYYMTTFKDVDIYLPTIESLFQSNKFYIPNATTQDLR